ncbi:hypothetical protein ACRAWD_02795 [Caulobacter segnis]
MKDDVFAWFAGMTPKPEAQFLCYAVDGALLGREGSGSWISKDWLAGRQAAAADFVEHERRDYPELYAKLTVDQDRAWVPRFETMLKDRSRRWSLLASITLSARKACWSSCGAPDLRSTESQSVAISSAP